MQESESFEDEDWVCLCGKEMAGLCRHLVGKRGDLRETRVTRAGVGFRDLLNCGVRSLQATYTKGRIQELFLQDPSLGDYSPEL